MKGIIVVNAYATTKSELNQALRLKEEFNCLSVEIDIVHTDEMQVIIENGNYSVNINNIDFCTYLDKDLHVLKMLEALNIKVFNNAKAIEICDDKLLTHIALANHDINMPKTIGGVLCYYKDAKVKKSIIDKVESELRYPLIIKENYGSCGKGIYLARNREELEQIANEIKLKPHLYQAFIKESQGMDIRVIVIGGKCIGAMCRQNTQDFRSNIEIGGTGTAQSLNKEYIEICEKVVNVLKLDYCGIDLLIDKDNNPVVCEVNSNAFFGMFEKVTNINVAKIYAEFIINELSKKMIKSP